jgi:hypothetical protein
MSDVQVATPLLCLSGRFDQGTSGEKKPSHVVGQKKSIRGSTEDAKRRLKVEHVAHHRDFLLFREEMIVIETPEGAAHHGIAEMERPLKHCDSTGEMLPDAEMPSAPGDFIAESHQTAQHAGHRTLAGLRGGVHVQFDAAREIEDALNGRVNLGRELDYRHNGARASGLANAH